MTALLAFIRRRGVHFAAALALLLIGIVIPVLMWAQPSCAPWSFSWALNYSPLAWLLICGLLIGGTILLWHTLSPSTLDFCWKWITARNLASSFTEAGKEGTSTFIALATFALAEGGALTAVAKGEGHDAIVLIIYALIVIFTFCWIVAMLRSTRKETASSGAAVDVQAYDSVSLRYGRITLAWTAILSSIMLFLGLNQLLPNQTTRIEFDLSEVVCEPLSYSDWNSVAGPIQQRMDKWIGRIAAEARQADMEGFFIIKQKSVFPDSYKPFALDVHCNDALFLGERTAFLVHSPANQYLPTYRQVPFVRADNTQTSTDTVSIADAKKGEYLLILVFIRDAKKEQLPSKAAIGMQTLTPHFR